MESDRSRREGAAVSPRSFGIEAITDEDRAYAGSRFSVVRDALFANPYQRTWGAGGEPPLPVHPVTLSSLLYGILPFGPPYAFRQGHRARRRFRRRPALGSGSKRLSPPAASERHLPDRPVADPAYSGYFRNGSRALVVGRYSTCCRETRRGHVRSLSLVGKLFPTADPDHVAPLRTASFMTQQDIGGDYNDYINDVELLNAPNTTALRRGLGMPLLMVVGVVFSLVDKKPSIRQLYQIAELGKAQGEPTRAPTFMRLTVTPVQPRIEGPGLDFRDEIMAQIYDRGDGRPKRTLTFNIDVTDDGETHGPPFRERRTSGIGAASEPSPSTRRSFHTMAISLSTSIIRRGVTTKTIPQPPRV